MINYHNVRSGSIRRAELMSCQAEKLSHHSFSTNEDRVAAAMGVEGQKSRTIALEGPATIYEAAALRETLRGALAQGRDFQNDLGDSGKWDLAGLQLLISCLKTGRGQGGSIRLARVPRNCREIADRSGLSDWLDSVSD
jgi:ABC-type transporter Mla MlaB component